MRIDRIVFLLFFMALVSSGLRSQDPIYSQYYNTPTSINPAFTGNFDAPVISLNYRNQWPLIDNAYNTYSIAYNQFLRKYNSGIGLSFLGDSAGDGAMKTNKINLLYSYNIEINDAYKIKLGIEASFIQSALNWDKFVFSDNLDPQYGRISPGGLTYPSSEVPPDDLTSNNIDVSSGMLLYSNLFYVGISMKHMNNPSIRFLNATEANQEVGLPLRWSIHTGASYILKKGHKNYESSFLAPSLIIVKQGEFLQATTGVYAQLGQFLTGTWLRYAYSNFDSFIIAAGWKFDIYKVMYSFDLPIGNVGLPSGGAHELGIIINFNKIIPDKSRYIECFEVLR